MLARAVCPDLQGFAGQQQQLDGSVVDGCSIRRANRRRANYGTRRRLMLAHDDD